MTPTRAARQRDTRPSATPVTALGVDIGGTKILAALVDAAGRAIDTLIAPTPARQGPAAILDRVAALLNELLSQPGREPRAIGVGAAGTIDTAGVVVAATDILPGWAGTPIAAELTSRLRLPTIALNDVHAAAFAEAVAGAARGSDEALVVAVGTGIGGAIVRAGALAPSPHGTAGSLGHLPAPGGPARECSCRAWGHLEPIASGPGMEASYREATGNPLTLREIGALAASGDEIAAVVIEEAATLLGRVVGGAINLLDPDVVVIGGGVAALGAGYLGAIRSGAALETMPGPDAVPILPAELGPSAAVVGAALAALAAH